VATFGFGPASDQSAISLSISQLIENEIANALDIARAESIKWTAMAAVAQTSAMDHDRDDLGNGSRSPDSPSAARDVVVDDTAGVPIDRLAALKGISIRTLERRVREDPTLVVGYDRRRKPVFRHEVIDRLTFRPAPGAELRRRACARIARAYAAAEKNGAVDALAIAVELDEDPRLVGDTIESIRIARERAGALHRESVRRRIEDARAAAETRQAQALADATQKQLCADRDEREQLDQLRRDRVQSLSIDEIGTDAWLSECVELECKEMWPPGSTIAELARHLGDDAAAWVRVEAWCAAHRDEIHSWQAGTP
jgi:hypothetical protein